MRLSNIVLIAIAMSGIGARVAEAADWKLDPPAGWPEDPEFAKQSARYFKELCPGKSEVKAWAGPEGTFSRVVALFCVFDSNGTPYRTQIDEMDRKAMDAMTKSSGGQQGKEKPQRIEGSMVIRDSAIVLQSTQVRVLRNYQPADDGLHVLMVTCSGLDTSGCDPSLDGAYLMVANPLGLDAVRGTSPEQQQSSVRFRALISIALCVVLVFAIRWWRANIEWPARRSTTEAAPPGARPGSDEEAGDR